MSNVTRALARSNSPAHRIEDGLHEAVKDQPDREAVSMAHLLNPALTAHLERLSEGKGLLYSGGSTKMPSPKAQLQLVAYLIERGEEGATAPEIRQHFSLNVNETTIRI